MSFLSSILWPLLRSRSSVANLLWGSEQRTRRLAGAAGMLLTTLAGWIALSRAGTPLESLSYDLPFVAHRAGGHPDVCVVYIDNAQYNLLDRRMQAPLLDRLAEAGVRAVIYDIVFDKPWPDAGVDDAFAESLRRFRGKDAEGNPVPGQSQRPALLACWRTNTSVSGADIETLTPPLFPFLSSEEDIGVVAFKHDRYTVRELNTGTKLNASLTWKAARLLGADLREEDRSLPRWINYAGPPPSPDDPSPGPAFTTLKASSVIAGVAPGLLRNKIVFIGGEPGLIGTELGEDLFYTPFHGLYRRGTLPLMAGVELQANVFTNLMRGNSLIRSTRTFDSWFVSLAGLLTGAGFALARPLRGLLAATSLVIILGLASVLCVHYGNFWFPWSVVAFLQVPVALVWGMGAHFYVERYFRLRLGAEQRQLREAFSKYLSPKMLEHLTQSGFQIGLGGMKAPVAMMFTDIESFTEMCQRVRDPARIVENLNDYFERTTRHIFEHDGVVIKFIGDAIFAAWGVPVPDPHAARDAVRAAWKLYMSARLVIEGEELRTRIGVNFGEAVAGNIGSEHHIDYTLIGDEVNLTSRLEGLNKILGTSILLSEAVVSRLDDEFVVRRVGKFKVKGRDDVTAIYELIGPASAGDAPPWVALYHNALAAMEAENLPAAEKLFEAVQAGRNSGKDGPTAFMLARIRDGDPIPEGVVTMTEK